eukprot:29731-Hanusia_phi.AAC.2
MDPLIKNVASSPKAALADTDASGVDEADRAKRNGPQMKRVTEEELAKKRRELQMLREQVQGNAAYKLPSAQSVGRIAADHQNVYPPPRSTSHIFPWYAPVKEGIMNTPLDARDNNQVNSTSKASLRFSPETETGLEGSQKKNDVKKSSSEHQTLLAANMELEKQLENLRLELKYVRQELKNQHGRQDGTDTAGILRLGRHARCDQAVLRGPKSQLFDSSEIISNQRKEIDRLQKAGLDFLDFTESAKEAEKKWSLHVEKLEAQIIDLQNELHALHSNRLNSTQNMLEAFAGEGDITLHIKVGKNILGQDIHHLLVQCLEIPNQQVAECKSMGKSLLLTILGNGPAAEKDPAQIVLEIFRKFRNVESAFFKHYSPRSIEICKEKGVEFQLSRMEEERTLYGYGQNSDELRRFQEALDAKNQTISDYEEEIKRWKQAFKRLEDDLDNHHQLMEQRLDLANSHIKLLQQERDQSLQSSYKAYAEADSDSESSMRNNAAFQSLLAQKDNELRSTKHALDILVHSLRQNFPSLQSSGPSASFGNQENDDHQIEQIVLTVSKTVQTDAKARSVLEQRTKEVS